MIALIVFLMSCDCKRSLALPHDAVGLSAVVSVVFPVYTHLLFAYLVSNYYNECLFIALFCTSFMLLK